MNNEYNEYMREYMAQRYQTRLEWALALLGGKCVRCASTDQLQFDHIDPATKSFTICDKLAGVAKAKLVVELAKCQLLCFECHKQKTAIEPRKAANKITVCCGRTFIGRQYNGHVRWHTG